jgi:hypothetical protein
MRGVPTRCTFLDIRVELMTESVTGTAYVPARPMTVTIPNTCRIGVCFRDESRVRTMTTTSERTLVTGMQPRELLILGKVGLSSRVRLNDRNEMR